MMSNDDKAVVYDYLNAEVMRAGFPDGSVYDYVEKLKKNQKTGSEQDRLDLIAEYRKTWESLGGDTGGVNISAAFLELRSLRAKVKDLEARPPQAAGSQWWDDLWAFCIDAGMIPGEKTQENEDIEEFIQGLIDIRDASEALEEEFDDEDFEGDEDDGILPATFSGCTFNILYA